MLPKWNFSFLLNCQNWNKGTKVQKVFASFVVKEFNEASVFDLLLALWNASCAQPAISSGGDVEQVEPHPTCT